MTARPKERGENDSGTSTATDWPGAILAELARLVSATLLAPSVSSMLSFDRLSANGLVFFTCSFAVALVSSMPSLAISKEESSTSGAAGTGNSPDFDNGSVNLPTTGASTPRVRSAL